ncbi:MAG: O-antigen ligase family protein [Candidatus Muiribacteriota bacterium]
MIFNPHSWYGVSIKAVLIRPSFFVAVVFIASCIINHQKLNWVFTKREFLFYIFVLCAFTVSFLFGVGVHDNSIKYLEKMLKFSIFIFFLLRTVNSEDDFNKILWCLILGNLFLAFQAHQIGQWTDGRLNNIGGTDFNESNGFAAFMSLGILLAGFKLFKKKVQIKFIIICCLAVMLNAIIMTQSRAVFMGGFFSLVFIFIKAPSVIKKELTIYSLCGIILFSFLAHDAFWERMNTIEGQAKLIEKKPAITYSFEISRIDIWSASVEIFKDNPLGIGVKNFEKIVSSYDPRIHGKDAHNAFVLCYTEIGAIGIILFLLYIFSGLFQLRRISKISDKYDDFFFRVTSLSLAAVLILFISGPMLTHSFLYSEFIWLILALPICLENALYNKYKEKAQI